MSMTKEQRDSMIRFLYNNAEENEIMMKNLQSEMKKEREESDLKIKNLEKKMKKEREESDQKIKNLHLKIKNLESEMKNMKENHEKDLSNKKQENQKNFKLANSNIVKEKNTLKQNEQLILIGDVIKSIKETERFMAILRSMLVDKDDNRDYNAHELWEKLKNCEKLDKPNFEVIVKEFKKECQLDILFMNKYTAKRNKIAYPFSNKTITFEEAEKSLNSLIGKIPSEDKIEIGNLVAFLKNNK